MKGFKVRVTEGESAKLQSVAFENGERWGSGCEKISHVTAPFLYFGPSGISFGNDSEMFFNHSYKELTVRDMMARLDS